MMSAYAHSVLYVCIFLHTAWLTRDRHPPPVRHALGLQVHSRPQQWLWRTSMLQTSQCSWQRTNSCWLLGWLQLWCPLPHAGESYGDTCDNERSGNVRESGVGPKLFEIWTPRFVLKTLYKSTPEMRIPYHSGRLVSGVEWFHSI